MLSFVQPPTFTPSSLVVEVGESCLLAARSNNALVRATLGVVSVKYWNCSVALARGRYPPHLTQQLLFQPPVTACHSTPLQPPAASLGDPHQNPKARASPTNLHLSPTDIEPSPPPHPTPALSHHRMRSVRRGFTAKHPPCHRALPIADDAVSLLPEVKPWFVLPQDSGTAVLLSAQLPPSFRWLARNRQLVLGPQPPPNGPSDEWIVSCPAGRS